jgi:hypothetical protein
VGTTLAVPTAASAASTDAPVDAKAFLDGLDNQDHTSVVYETVQASFGATFASNVSNYPLTATLDLSHLSSALSVQIDPVSTNYCTASGTIIVCAASISTACGYGGFSVDFVPGTPWTPSMLGSITMTISSPDDPDTSDNTRHETLHAATNTEAQLVVTGETQPQAQVGQVVTLPIDVHNAGPNVEPGYDIDEIGFFSPDGGAVATGSTPGCSISAGTFTCAGSWLMPGDTDVFVLHFRLVKSRNDAGDVTYTSGYTYGGIGVHADWGPLPDLFSPYIYCGSASGSDASGSSSGSTQAGNPSGSSSGITPAAATEPSPSGASPSTISPDRDGQCNRRQARGTPDWW